MKAGSMQMPQSMRTMPLVIYSIEPALFTLLGKPVDVDERSGELHQRVLKFRSTSQRDAGAKSSACVAS